MATSGRHRRNDNSPYQKARFGNGDYLDMEKCSLVKIAGIYKIKCGYCKPETKTSVSYGLYATRLTCADYQDLIDRGWRRSGTFVYKYTIRLDVTRFKPAKGQRHVLNRLKRYLEADHYDIARKDTGKSNTNGQTKVTDRKIDAITGMKNRDSNNNNNKKSDNRSGGRALNGGTKRRKDASRGGAGLANSGCRRDDSEGLTALSRHMTAAAGTTLEGGVVPGLFLEPNWRSKVAGWSQVRPIRSKNCRLSGGGFCSSVALSIASAARKQGWKGTGGAGGAVVVAEAIADTFRDGQKERKGSCAIVVSEINVAPNGFISFAADVRPSSSPVGVLEHRPPTPLSKAVAEAATRESLIPPATPPSTAAFTQSSPLNTRAYLHDHALSTAKESLATSSSEGVQRTADPAEQGRSQCTAVWQGVGPENMDIHSTNEFVKSGLAGAAAVPTCVGAVGNRMEDGGKGGENITATAAAAVGAARVEWIEERGGARGVLVDAEESTTPVDAASAGEDSSATGLASLPPLDPKLAPHRMTISTVPARVTDEVFDLYFKYQVSVHGDEPSEVNRVQFCRFLVETPLVRETAGGMVVKKKETLFPRPPMMFLNDETKMEEETNDDCAEMTEGRDSLSVPCGSYHQLYRIDGQLVAVGVIDILPKCLSSVYCFYDPDFRALALGKLTALKETEFVREARSLRPALRDYYMGFYIHTCPKMSYKGSYFPSSLLCPERLSWVPLEVCRPVLDKHKYARLSDLLSPPSSYEYAAPSDTGFGPAIPEGNRRQQRIDAIEKLRSGGSQQGSDAADSSGRPRKLPRSPSARPASSDGAGMDDTFSNYGQGLNARSDATARMAAAVEAARMAANEASEINEIPLSVGLPYPVYFAGLVSHAQAVVMDVLSTYSATIGPELSKRVLLKLSN